MTIQPTTSVSSRPDLASGLPATSGSGYTPTGVTTSAGTSDTGGGSGTDLVSAAKSFIGTPYVYGGTGAGGIDCSGLTQAAYAKLGYNIGRDTSAQFKSGQAVGQDGNFQQTLNNLQPGDLLFYGQPGATGPNAHVAMYIGNGQVIQAAHTGTNVSTGPVYASAASDEPFLGARRYIQPATAASSTTINTPTDFANTVLQKLGIAANPGNVAGLVAWENAEGGNWHNPDTYNPLNTTQQYGGSHGTNGPGVQAYNSWVDGIAATLQTLNNGRYGAILQALRGSDPQAIEQAVASSPWGTGAFSVGGAPRYR
jgi:cell wall-associated NlpC family hydrolase